MIPALHRTRGGAALPGRRGIWPIDGQEPPCSGIADAERGTESR